MSNMGKILTWCIRIETNKIVSQSETVQFTKKETTEKLLHLIDAMTTPASSAECEQGFSATGQVKTHWGSRPDPTEICHLNVKNCQKLAFFLIGKNCILLNANINFF